MPLPRLRRGPRLRASDDDDWGTSSPADIMEPPPPPPPLQDRSVAVALSRLKQQELDSYTCTFSPRSVISLYFAIALIFLPIGAAITAATTRIASTAGHIRYDDICRDHTTNDTCTVQFNVTADTPPNSYLFYALTNFHQNTRDYVKSRSDVQNQGKLPKAQLDIANCERWICSDGTDSCVTSNYSDIIYPCGLTARFVFNDTFTICTDPECAKKPVELRKEGIAWWTDSTHKFVSNENEEVFTRPRPQLFVRDENRSANELLEDEDFVVWMRLSAFPTFEKLYRIIPEPLKAGTPYYMHISNTFDVSSFNGTKSFYISSTAWFGTRNVFLGTIYLVVGTTALFIALVLLFKHALNPSAPTKIDASTLLREHLAKFNIDTPDPLHEN